MDPTRVSRLGTAGAQRVYRWGKKEAGTVDQPESAALRKPL